MTEVPIIKNVSIDLQTGFNMIGTSDMKELNGNSRHSFHIVKNIPKGQFRRSRICSECNYFLSVAKKLFSKT